MFLDLANDRSSPIVIIAISGRESILTSSTDVPTPRFTYILVPCLSNHPETYSPENGGSQSGPHSGSLPCPPWVGPASARSHLRWTGQASAVGTTLEA